MAIKLNPDIWGSNEHLVLSTLSQQRHGHFYYPYYKATNEEYQAAPDKIITIFKAVDNGYKGLSQSTTNSALDYTICSWSINGNAAINKPYYIGYYYNNNFDIYTIDIAKMFATEDTAYPAFFVGGTKAQSTGYTYLNNSHNLKDKGRYNIDFSGPDFISTIPTDILACNTPIASFGYKSPLLLLKVCCCTDKCFNTYASYGIVKSGKPTTIDDNNFYRFNVYDYFNSSINGTAIKDLYPIVIYVCYVEAIDTLSDSTEGTPPTRGIDINNIDSRSGVHAMSIVKMISLRDYESDSIFGANGTPWDNWNNIYNDVSNYRIILGMSLPTGNANYLMDKISNIDSTLGLLAYETKTSLKKDRTCPTFLRSHKPDLIKKEITRRYYYNNKPMLLIGYKNLSVDEILTEASYLGMWFCTLDHTSANMDINLYDVCNGQTMSGYQLDDYYMPIFDEHMVTTGRYISASEINKNPDELSKQYPNIKWGWDFNLDPDYKFDPNYRPPKPDDDGKYEDKQKDKGSLSTTYHNNYKINGFDAYILNSKGIKSIKNDINSQLKPPADVTADDWIKLDWYGQDPASFILAVNKFPCNVNVQSMDTRVTIGRTKLSIPNPDDPLNPTPIYAITAAEQLDTLEFGTLELKPYYNDFRDYAPYSNYTVHIPYFADYTLDPKIWLNHTCKIKIDYDVVTCNAMAEIWRDDMWYDTIYGTFGTPIPFLTYNTGGYQNAIVNAQANLESSKNAMTQSFLSTAVSVVSTGVGIATGNIPLSVGGAMGLVNTATRPIDAYNKVQNAEYNLRHTAPNPTGTSGVGGVTALTTRNYCTLIISRPQPLHYSKSMYGKTIGFACCETGILANYHGLTVCSNTRFSSFSGTQSELAEIQQLLKTGVILP